MSDSDDLFKLFAPSYYFDTPRQYDDSDWFIVAEQSISVDEEAFWAVVVSICHSHELSQPHPAHMLFLRLTNCNPLCAEKMDSRTWTRHPSSSKMRNCRSSWITQRAYNSNFSAKTKVKGSHIKRTSRIPCQQWFVTNAFKFPSPPIHVLTTAYLETHPARVTFAPDVISENQLPFYYPKVLYCIVLYYWMWMRCDCLIMISGLLPGSRIQSSVWQSPCRRSARKVD